MTDKAEASHVAARVDTAHPYWRLGCVPGPWLSFLLHAKKLIHPKINHGAGSKYVNKKRSRIPEGTVNQNWQRRLMTGDNNLP